MLATCFSCPTLSGRLQPHMSCLPPFYHLGPTSSSVLPIVYAYSLHLFVRRKQIHRHRASAPLAWVLNLVAHVKPPTEQCPPRVPSSTSTYLNDHGNPLPRLFLLFQRNRAGNLRSQIQSSSNICHVSSLSQWNSTTTAASNLTSANMKIVVVL